MSYNLIIILGATASGKTKLAVEVAKALNTEIISADSRQVFKGMDIGTGKDLDEYLNAGVPYHLINIKEAGQRYHVNFFKEDFFKAFQDIQSRNKMPILCGGTGMYIHSLLQEHQLTAVPVNDQLRFELLDLTKDELIEKLKTYPSALMQQADLSSKKRLVRAIEIAEYLSSHPLPSQSYPVLKPLVFGLVDDVDLRRSKILNRLSRRLEEGLIEEVKDLVNQGVSQEMLVFYGLEYKFVVEYLEGKMDRNTLQERLGIAICQFAKRQMTFFRKMEKDGVEINWLAADSDFLDLKREVLKHLAI